MKAHLPLIVALLAAAILLSPALSGSHLVGIEAADGYGTQWFYWLTEQNLRQGGGWSHTDAFFYPWGKDLLGHTGSNFLDALLAAPLRMLLGPVAGYNAAALLMLLLNGLAFAVLARDLTDDARVVGLSAVLFALSPYALFELIEGRPTQVLLAPLVLFVWQLRRPGLKSAALAGLFLAIAGYQYWFYAFFGGMIALAHGLVGAVKTPRLLLHHALTAGVALLLCAPVAGTLLLNSAQGITPGLLQTSDWSLSAVQPVTREGMSIGLRVWQPLHAIVGDYTINPMTGEQRFAPLANPVPFTALLCLIAVLFRPDRIRRGPWLAMVLTAGLLAMGPLVLVGKSLLVEPLYLGLVKSLSFLQRLWWPARALAALSVLLGMAVTVALSALSRRGMLWIGGPAVVVLWVGELWLSGMAPLPTWDATVPAGYRCLASGPPGALLELPHAWSRAHLYYQTAHGRPIMGGMLENQEAFMPPEAVAVSQRNTFLVGMRIIADLRNPQVSPSRTDRHQLYELGYRYVVLHRDAYLGRDLPQQQLRLMDDRLRELLGAPVYEDVRVRIYAPWGDPPPCSRDQVTPDTEGIGRTEVAAEWWGRRELVLSD